MLQSLLPGVRDLSLQPVDRLGLQNDLFSLVKFSLRCRIYQNVSEKDVSELCPVFSLVQG